MGVKRIHEDEGCADSGVAWQRGALRDLKHTTSNPAHLAQHPSKINNNIILPSQSGGEKAEMGLVYMCGYTYAIIYLCIVNDAYCKTIKFMPTGYFFFNLRVHTPRLTHSI